MTNLQLIEKLCNARGASGFEDEVTVIAREYAGDFAHFKEDSMRNLFIYPKYNKGNRPVVMLDAHSDEVGFMVQAIKPNGTLKFIPIGGWNEKSLPSSKVQIFTAGGYIHGIIGAESPHLMTAEQKNAPISCDTAFIDIGASSTEEAINMGVNIGAPVTPYSPFEINDGGIMQGKAFDDRLGVAAMLICLKELKEKDLKVDVVGVLSSQEEVGERGITAAMGSIKADAAICLEGCPSDDTSAPEYMVQAALGRGVMLRHMDRSIICTPRFIQFAKATAERNNVKIQLAVRSGGGNNGAYIISSNGATPTIVASIPVRYIHTFNSIANMSDLTSCIELTKHILKSLNADIIASF